MSTFYWSNNKRNAFQFPNFVFFLQKSFMKGNTGLCFEDVALEDVFAALSKALSKAGIKLPRPLLSGAFVNKA